MNSCSFGRALLLVMITTIFKHTNVSSIILLLSTLGVVMEQVKFDYSMKNIPIPSKEEFMIQMIHSVEYFVKNIRWRAFFFLNPSQSTQSKETFGFRSTSPAPFVPELREFELKLYDLTKNIRFRNRTNSFQTKLNGDSKKIKGETNMIIAADKTSNFYKVSKTDYEALLEKNITKDYKKN